MKYDSRHAVLAASLPLTARSWECSRGDASERSSAAGCEACPPGRCCRGPSCWPAHPRRHGRPRWEWSGWQCGVHTSLLSITYRRVKHWLHIAKTIFQKGCWKSISFWWCQYSRRELLSRPTKYLVLAWRWHTAGHSWWLAWRPEIVPSPLEGKQGGRSGTACLALGAQAEDSLCGQTVDTEAESECLGSRVATLFKKLLTNASPN